MREEEMRPETEEEESETPPIESDSEGLVMAPRPSKRKQKPGSKPGNSVTVAINHLSLEEGADAMINQDKRQLFVEYKFLGIDPQETETPFSLPKPKPYHSIQYNFSKTFHVDFENNYQRRQYLASMLLPSDPDGGRIRFTLVSEPPEDEPEGDCENVGVALVNVRDILRNRKDVVEEDIDILGIADEETVIGSMNLTVQCLSALDSVEKEMKVEEEISEDISPEQSQRSTMREEEIRPETEGGKSETPPKESDSEGLVMAPRPSKRKQKPESKPGNSVTVVINHMSLEEGAGVMINQDKRQLFIEYKFLGIDPHETETPFSLPKPKPYHSIQYNFSKTFHVDYENNCQKRQYLARMLLPSDPDDGRIRFTLVSEPPEDEPEGDCENVGVALVNVRDILRNRKDVVEEDIDILGIADEETVIGSMNLTVQCLSALDSVEKEMKVEGTY